MFTLTVSENPVNDLHTHTLYLATSAVNSLPLRRRLKAGKLKELVMLPSELAQGPLLLVLRVKHVALNFQRDFNASGHVVPGSRIIGKLPTKLKSNVSFSVHDKMVVFPHLACWLQGGHEPCDNCIRIMAEDTLAYEAHARFPCEKNWRYGVTLDGGLQDYIRVLLPQNQLIRIPEGVSVHDCCFLFDIALPFYAYCKDVLCPLLQKVPDCRILVVLNDSATEANDCLLVIHHLHLDHLLITFTDMAKLNAVPLLLATYANKFHHVLVFAAGQGPVTAALALGLATGLESTKLRHTIALFGDAVGQVYAEPPDRTVHRVHLSYKDKFLMEELLQTLADLNRTTDGPRPVILYMQSLDLADTVTYNLALSNGDECGETIADNELWSTSLAKKKKLRFKGEAEVVTMGHSISKNHISWLHCDRDFRLCLDDHCDHDTLRRCHSTGDINAMLQDKSKLQRVFYTNRPASHVKINAFIF